MNSQLPNTCNNQAPSLPGANPRSIGRESTFPAATPICAVAPVGENKMTSTLRSAGIGTISLLVLFGVVTQAEATVTSLYGDMDGFGQGIPMSDGINYVGNGGNFSDHRDAGDIANAPNTDSWEAGYPLSWTFNYVALGATSAVLQFYIAGFADIGSVDLWVDINPAYKCSDIRSNYAMCSSCQREMLATYHLRSLMNFAHALSPCGKEVTLAALSRFYLRFITTASGDGWRPSRLKAPVPSAQLSGDARLPEAAA